MGGRSRWRSYLALTRGKTTPRSPLYVRQAIGSQALSRIRFTVATLFPVSLVLGAEESIFTGPPCATSTSNLSAVLLRIQMRTLGSGAEEEEGDARVALHLGHGDNSVPLCGSCTSRPFFCFSL